MARGPYSTLKGAPLFRLRQERKRAGWTQEKLAEALEVDDSTVSKRERGLQDFPVSDLLRMAEIFGCAPGNLIRDGDGLTEDERGLIAFLRANPQDAKVLLSTYQALREARSEGKDEAA